MSATAPTRLERWAAAHALTLSDRDEFLAALRGALAEGRGFAAGKLGVSERALLYHPRLLACETDPRRLAAFEQSLAFKAGRQSGLFPARAEFLRAFSPWYAEQVRALDSIGVMDVELDRQHEMVSFHRLPGRLIEFRGQEPDRSSPAQEGRCYLPLLRDRRVLLVCPFAEFLATRANGPTFEAVWAKTGKPWFHPAEVMALEPPYGFLPETQRRYRDSFALFDELAAALAEHPFDVALIAAGGLGIPLAAAAKRAGKVALSLGGHLQILFGVLGARWRDRESWRRRYFNDAWVTLPDRYRPDPRFTSENYW